MMMDTSQIMPGMEVFGANGDRVGRVKEVRVTDFLVDRPMQRDVYISLDAVQTIGGNDLTLTVPANQVDDISWSITESEIRP